MATAPVKLFLSYSHKDEAFREELETHLSLLRRQGLIDAWTDRRITAGNEWAKDISDNLLQAEVVLLLVSSSFMASDYCFDKEMAVAMDMHRQGKKRVIPILIRPTDWHEAPFATLQALPRDGKPLSSWNDRDEGWLDVARGIRRVVESMQGDPNRVARLAGQPPPGAAQVQATVPSGAAPGAGAPVTAPPAAAAPSPAAQLTLGAIRKELRRVLRTPADFDAFCMDHFPKVFKHFTSSMNAVEKESLLLNIEDSTAILNTLRDHGVDY